MAEEELQDVEVVYLGECDVVGGKGIMVTTPALLAGCVTLSDVDNVRSVFPKPKGRGTYTVGCKYTARAILGSDGHIDKMVGTSLRFRGRTSHDLIAVLEGRQEGRAAEESAKRMEAKIRAEPKLMEEMAYLRMTYQSLKWSDQVGFEQAVARMLRRP